jgi:hypothetical protein
MEGTRVAEQYYSAGLGLSMDSSEEIFVILQVAVLMGIVQNLTHKSYFASYVFMETPVFVQALTD